MMATSTAHGSNSDRLLQVDTADLMKIVQAVFMEQCFLQQSLKDKKTESRGNKNKSCR